MKLIHKFFLLLCLFSSNFAEANNGHFNYTPFSSKLFAYCNEQEKCELHITIKNTTQYKIEIMSFGADKEILNPSLIKVSNAEKYRELEIANKSVFEARLENNYSGFKNGGSNMRNLLFLPSEEKIIIFENFHEHFDLKSNELYFVKLALPNVHYYVDEKYIGVRSLRTETAIFGFPDKELNPKYRPNINLSRPDVQ